MRYLYRGMRGRRIRVAVAAVAAGSVASVIDVEAGLFACWLAVLATLSWHDLRTRAIPTGIVNPATIVGGAALAAVAWRTGDMTRFGLAAATAAAAYAAFAVAHLLNPGGLGYGDVRLSGLLGLFLGWLAPSAMLAGVFLGTGAAAAVGLLMMLAGHGIRATLPFGPFLAAGAATVALLHTAAPLRFT